MVAVGEYGAVNVEEGAGEQGISWAKKDGMHFDAGFSSILEMELINETLRKLVWSHDQVGIIVIEDRVQIWQDIKPLMQACIASGVKKVLIFGDMRGDIIEALNINKQKFGLHSCIVRIPFSGIQLREVLKDVAIYTGATFFSSGGGMKLPTAPLKEGDLSFLGIADRVIVDREHCYLTGGKGEEGAIKKRIELIEGLSAGEKEPYELQFLRERLARFCGSIATISVVGATRFETNSLRTRVDDAVCAVRSANEEGVLPGGGVALLRALQALESRGEASYGTDGEKIGRKIVMEALKCPAVTIAEMAEHNGDVVVSDILRGGKEDSWTGFDFFVEEMCDMGKRGIIDPTKVVRLSLINSLSVSGDLSRLGATITDLSEEPSKDNWSQEAKALSKARIRGVRGSIE